MASKKRKVLTLDERVKAIKLVESGKSSRKVAEDFGVGRTQIQETLKRKREIMEDYENKQFKTSGLIIFLFYLSSVMYICS